MDTLAKLPITSCVGPSRAIAFKYDQRHGGWPQPSHPVARHSGSDGRVVGGGGGGSGDGGGCRGGEGLGGAGVGDGRSDGTVEADQ